MRAWQIVKPLYAGIVVFWMAFWLWASNLTMAQAPAAKPKEDITVIVGSEVRREDAEARVRALAAQGITAFVAQTATPSGIRYRVCVGRFATRAEADALKKQLTEKNGLRDAWLYGIPAESANKTLSGMPDSLRNLPPIDTVAFKAFYKKTVAAMAQGNATAVDAAINPAQGLYIVHNPGAHRVAQQFKLYSAFLVSSILDLPEAKELYRGGMAEYAAGVPMSGALPTYNCQTDAYSHQGLYLKQLLPNEKILAAALRSMKEFGLGESFSAAEQADAQRQEQDIRICVRHSEGAIVTGLYFSFIGGRWYLAMIDLTTPCDA